MAGAQASLGGGTLRVTGDKGEVSVSALAASCPLLSRAGGFLPVTGETQSLASGSQASFLGCTCCPRAYLLPAALLPGLPGRPSQPPPRNH